MIAAHDLRQNAAFFNAAADALAYKKIVDAPPRVVLPGVEAVGPPGVDPLRVRVEIAEAVCKAGGEQGSHFLSLLVGKSGVGKSTLINLVMRLYDVTEGSIRIDGIDIREISQHSLRSQIGVVLQETILFSGSVYDNLLYAKADATREEIIDAAKIAGAHEFIIKLPDGYNTVIGERGHTLSGCLLYTSDAADE